MAAMTENERVEYSLLMSRGRDAERTSHFCWIASGIAATMLLSWAIAARNSGLMLPVIFAVARTAGWVARVLEYLPENRIFRPRAAYDGPVHVQYVPIAQR